MGDKQTVRDDAPFSEGMGLFERWLTLCVAPGAMIGASNFFEPAVAAANALAAARP